MVFRSQKTMFLGLSIQNSKSNDHKVKMKTKIGTQKL